MDDIATLLEMGNLERKIQSYEKKISSLKKKISDCEKGLDELAECESKVSGKLGEEKAKWDGICGSLPCQKFNENCMAKTSQLFHGAKYQNFESLVSDHRMSLNNEILDYEDEIREYETKICNAEDNLRGLKERAAAQSEVI